MTRQTITRALGTLLLIAFLLPVSNAAQEWTLDNKQSSLTYLSTKMPGEALQSIFEPNRFESFSGSINAKGQIEVKVDLNSVNTGIEIRDERVRQYVFLTERYPYATITLSLPDIAQDKDVVRSVQAKLQLRGHAKDVTAKVYVRRYLTNKGKEVLIAQSAEPVLLNVAEYGMLDGFAKLKELAKLFQITHTIPVSFHFLFTRGPMPE